ncbi:MAG: thioredoxin family protein [Litorimonas sp.]
MTSFFKTTVLSIAALFGTGASMAINANAQTHYAPTPDIYVVMFRADWCAPCKIVEPRLQSVLQNFNDPRIEYVSIDIGNGNGDFNANAVFDRGLVQQYNTWLGVTGFAAIVDGDTKQTMGCVNLTYDADTMARHIRNLQSNAQRNQATFDITCPEANN